MVQIPAPPTGKNVVHQDEIRRDVIKCEELAAREFPETWGFLCGPKIEGEAGGFRNVIAKYHGGTAGVASWTLYNKRVKDGSRLGVAAREMDEKLKPKMGYRQVGHRSNIVPGIVDKYGRTLTKGDDEGYDCIPTRSAALALRSHSEHTIGDSVRGESSK